QSRIYCNHRCEGEQPEEHFLTHSQTENFDLHWCIRIRQIIDRLRYDSRRVDAIAERELQHVCTKLPAACSAARYGRDREPEHGGYCGPEAIGRRFPFHDGHDYGYLS